MIIHERNNRMASFYVPLKRGLHVCAALATAEWDAQFQPWNDENDLVRVKVPADKTDAEFIQALEPIVTDLTVTLDIEDSYFPEGRTNWFREY